MLNVTADGGYVIASPSGVDWWAWQACDAINLQLQDRWGLVQFKRNVRDRSFRFEKWHIYKALFDTMNAMKTYKVLHSRYVNAVQELDIPPYLMSRTCVEIPEIKLVKRGNVSDFDVSVKSMYISHKPAHIRNDRYVWFE